MSEPQKIVDGLYILEGAVNLYLLDDPETGITIIDVGMPRFTKRILEAVKSLGKQPQDVKQILITHADIDHIGSLAPVIKATGAKVYTGAETARYIETRTQPPHMPFFINGPVSLLTLLIKAGKVDQIIQAGETLPIAGGIRVLDAAGHTPDNLNFFWEREKVLFAPDLLSTISNNQLGLTLPLITWNMDVAKTNAKKVLDLNPAYICVGHGKFVDVAKTPQQVENLRQKLN